MNTDTKNLVAALLAALMSCAAVPHARADDPTPLMQKRADHAEQRAQERLKQLAWAIQQEKRDAAWAGKKESDLRASYMQKGLQPGALKSIECRSSKCLLELQISADPMEALKQLPAVEDWLAMNAGCAYTMVSRMNNSEGMPDPVQVYVNCGR